MPDNQAIIEDKLSLFLITLGNENLAQFAGGLCNAFAFMNFRAEFIGEEDKNLRRMQKLMEQDDKDIIQMAKLYQEYKNERRSLIENKESENEISKINRDLDRPYQQLTVLRKKFEVGKETKDHEAILLLEEEMRKLRNERDQLMEKALNKKFGSEKLKKIHDAEELYIYTHTLASAFDPGEKLDFHIQGKYVQQNDFIEILMLLPPDILLPKEIEGKLEKKELKPIAEKSYEIAFTYTENELIELFSNKLHKNTIREGDYIRLSSGTHTIYLSYKDGTFRLVDPAPIEIKPNTPEKLVAAIKERFFTRFGRPTEYMPMAMSVFRKGDSEKEQVEKPNVVSVIQSLLKNRKEKNINAKAWDHSTAIFMAAKYGHADVVKMLIEEGADFNAPNNGGSTPAWIAAQNGHADVIKVLAEFKADLDAPNKKGVTPIFIATQLGHANVIKILAKAVKTDLNALNQDGVTLAYLASQKGYTDVIRVLHESKVDLNLPTKQGSTPATIAAQIGHINVIEALAEAGVNLNIPNKKGHTPAIIAAFNGHPAVIKKLLDYKVDLNIPDSNNGKTPLHMAVNKSDFATIKVLLEGGANLYIPDKLDETAIDYADEKIQSFILLQLLKKYITTHHLEKNSGIIARQLQRIETAEGNNGWTEALQDVISMARDSFFEQQSIPSFWSSYFSSFLFSKEREKDESQKYLEWFSYPQKLQEQLKKALWGEKPSLKPEFKTP